MELRIWKNSFFLKKYVEKGQIYGTFQWDSVLRAACDNLENIYAIRPLDFLEEPKASYSDYELESLAPTTSLIWLYDVDYDRCFQQLK